MTAQSDPTERPDDEPIAPDPSDDPAAGGAPDPDVEPGCEGHGQAPPDDAASPAEGLESPDAEELYARLQRVTADYLNFQKRARKQQTEAREMANDALVKDLLGVLDDMERALAAARENHAPDDPLLTGMQLVHDNLLSTLGRYGLEPIEAENQPFDPELHQAVQQVPSPDHPPQTVVQDLQKGYRLKRRTIRPSMVVVSTAAESDAEE